jgi:hypothetical protein
VAVKVIVGVPTFGIAVMPVLPCDSEQAAPLLNRTGELTVIPAEEPGGTATVPTLMLLTEFVPSVTPSAANTECEIVPLVAAPVTRIGYVPRVAVHTAFNVSVAGEPALITVVLRPPVTPPVIAPMFNITVPLNPVPAGAMEMVKLAEAFIASPSPP